MNDDLTEFQVTVEINLHDENKFWKRVSQVKLNKKEGLIRSCKVLKIEIIDKSPKDKNKDKDKKDVNNDKSENKQSDSNDSKPNKEGDEKNDNNK